jgi:hypothetical protein
MADDTSAATVGRHRPKSTTVFVAAFVAGAVAAVVVNRALDLHLAQSKPQVESEPIFVALRALPQGSPVTVWDVALRDWPRAMMPTSALRAGDTFEGSVLKYPVREGQPLLAVQLMPAEQPAAAQPAAVEEAFVLPPQAAPVKQVASAPPAAEEPNPQESEVVAVKPTQPEAAPAVSTESAPVEPTKVDTVASEPKESPAPTRKPFDLEPTEEPSTATTATTEPGSSTPTPAVTEAEPTRVASDVEPLLEPPPRPAVDLEKIPSVMARSEEPAEPAEAPASTGPVRYLVVPERIARQADTSFVPPPAVEPTPESAPTPTPPLATKPTKPTQSAQASTPPVKGFPQRSGTQKTASRSTPKQTQARGQQQGTQPQRKPQPQASTKQQRSQSGSPAPDRARTETAAKPREPMFPVLAAGIEAMGNRWRNGGEEAEATDQPAAQRRK